jgi:hypothetical protein
MKKKSLLGAALRVAFCGAVVFVAAQVIVDGISILWALQAGIGGGMAMAFLTNMPKGAPSDTVLAHARRWHGKMEDQCANIDILISIIVAHQPLWTIATPLLRPLTEARDRLLELFRICKSPSASSLDLEERNTLLKQTVDRCLLDIKLWAYGHVADGILTVEDVHSLGFLMPGEVSKHHEKTEATNAKAEVKVTVISPELIRATIDQSAGENAALVVNGWPNGVKYARVVITAEDGVTVVYDQITTTLHNDIKMPDGSHGKLFFIKASFLKHVKDEPRFGNEPTFTMPKTTSDVASGKNNG